MTNKKASHKDTVILEYLLRFDRESGVQEVMRSYAPTSWQFKWAIYMCYLQWVVDTALDEANFKTIDDQGDFVAMTLNEPQFDKAFNVAMITKHMSAKS